MMIKVLDTARSSTRDSLSKRCPLPGESLLSEGASTWNIQWPSKP